MKNTSGDHPDDTEDAMTRSAPTHNVRDTISKILSGSNALKRISDMSQKRHV